jgi:hypothetical protein
MPPFILSPSKGELETRNTRLETALEQRIDDDLDGILTARRQLKS